MEEKTRKTWVDRIDSKRTWLHQPTSTFFTLIMIVLTMLFCIHAMETVALYEKNAPCPECEACPECATVHTEDQPCETLTRVTKINGEVLYLCLPPQ